MVISYNWKKFECELCHKRYPYSFKLGQKLYKIIDFSEEFEKIKSSGILLESMPLDKKTGRFIHLLKVTPDTRVFTFGRARDVSVKIDDISVSRVHTKIIPVDGNFYI